MAVLIQFMFRLSFGMALAMAVTPARLVTSGYYRVHLWVLLGLSTVATLAALSRPGHLAEAENEALWMSLVGAAVLAALACYVGSVLWLYEKAGPGTITLYLVSMVSLLGAALATPWSGNTCLVLGALDLIFGGLVLGVTIAAMFLGHWYLNTPTMQLLPLRRLVLLMAGVVVVRTVLCAVGLGMELSHGSLGGLTVVFITIRWLFGLIGTLMMAVMAWQTLKIPNTQSTTGILYVGVIFVFVGELVSQLLSVDSLYPL